jgi:hypothetical protein
MIRKLWFLMAFVLCFTSSVAFGKKKEKAVFPEILVRAQTVFVMIQPDAGEPMNDPAANRKVREEVEKALMSWGRYRLVQEAYTADIVVAVKKGTEKAATPTISGGPVDKRPVTLETTDDQLRIGAAQGRPPGSGSDETSSDGRAHPSVEVGSSDDSFLVYLGGETFTPNSASIWSYRAKNALRPPDVAAVQQLRKAIADAEKAAAQKQQQRSPQPKTP